MRLGSPHWKQILKHNSQSIQYWIIKKKGKPVYKKEPKQKKKKGTIKRIRTKSNWK